MEQKNDGCETSSSTGSVISELPVSQWILSCLISKVNSGDYKASIVGDEARRGCMANYFVVENKLGIERLTAYLLQ